MHLKRNRNERERMGGRVEERIIECVCAYYTHAQKPGRLYSLLSINSIDLGANVWKCLN